MKIPTILAFAILAFAVAVVGAPVVADEIDVPTIRVVTLQEPGYLHCSGPDPNGRLPELPVSEYWGTDYQGTDYQGTDYQGTHYHCDRGYVAEGTNMIWKHWLWPMSYTSTIDDRSGRFGVSRRYVWPDSAFPTNTDPHISFIFNFGNGDSRLEGGTAWWAGLRECSDKPTWPWPCLQWAPRYRAVTFVVWLDNRPTHDVRVDLEVLEVGRGFPGLANDGERARGGGAFPPCVEDGYCRKKLKRRDFVGLKTFSGKVNEGEGTTGKRGRSWKWPEHRQEASIGFSAPPQSSYAYEHQVRAVRVYVAQDDRPEGNETFKIVLRNLRTKDPRVQFAGGGSRLVVPVTIVDDDQAKPAESSPPWAGRNLVPEHAGGRR